MAEFFHMGGYGGYVWPAYLSSAIVLGGITAVIWRRRRRSQQQLDQIARAAQESESETARKET